VSKMPLLHTPFGLNWSELHDEQLR